MSTKASEDANPKAEAASEEKEGGLFPAILAGGGILAVVGILAFYPFGDDASEGASGAAGSKGAGASMAGGAVGAGGKGGVQAREVDEARAGHGPTPKVNPAIKLPAVGMAPGVPPPEEPPTFNNAEEEIAWYERKLEAAIQMRDSRKKFADRLPKVRERIEQSDNPDAQLEAFENRKKIVEANYEKAQKRVEEIEAKLDELR